MKKIMIGIILLLFLGGLGYVYTRNSLLPNSKKPLVPSISTAPSPITMQSFCLPQQVQATVQLSPGAGNVYGTFTLKNISQQVCQILGNAFIQVNYNMNAIKNISIIHIGETQKQPFILSTGQVVYSQVHYPNGPQCHSVGIRPTPITFTYTISPTNTVTFTSPSQNISQVVQTCASPTDITTVQIWGMSSQPITP